MNVRRYRSEDANHWNDFVKAAHNGSLLFDRGFMDYHLDRFPDHSLIVEDGDKWMAILPGTVSGAAWVSHAGLSYGGLVYPLATSQRKVNEAFGFCLNTLRKLSVSEVVIKMIPDIYCENSNKALEYAMFREGFTLYRRDAATTVNLASPGKVTKGRKASLAKAKREGVVAEESHGFAEFMAFEDAHLQSKYGVNSVHTGAEMELLHSRFPEQIRLVTARREGELLAGGVVFLSGPVCHLQYFGMNDLGGELGATDLVIEQLLLLARAEKKSYFDFGISTEKGGRYLNEGLMRYKESFGGVTTLADFYQLLI